MRYMSKLKLWLLSYTGPKTHLFGTSRVCQPSPRTYTYILLPHVINLCSINCSYRRPLTRTHTDAESKTNFLSSPLQPPLLQPVNGGINPFEWSIFPFCQCGRLSNYLPRESVSKSLCLVFMYEGTCVYVCAMGSWPPPPRREPWA